MSRETAEGCPTPVAIAVDPRTELMSTLWRLAGVRQEYMWTYPNAHYISENEGYFASFREHPCVRFVSEVQQRWGAPMALAVHVSDTVDLHWRVPLEPYPSGLEKCWGPDGAEVARRVVEEARAFVVDADFNGFWQAHESLYRGVENRHRQFIGSEGHFDWFPRFFGRGREVALHIILCMMNAGCCYPAWVELDEGMEYYCFLGMCQWDDRGIPVPTSASVFTMAHEFAHLFTPEGYIADMREAGERLLQRVRDRIDWDAYGAWERVIDESVANACMVRYALATQGEEAGDRAIREAIGKGFLWIRELSDLLGQYERNRSEYPDFEAFVPEIVTFFWEEAARGQATR